MHILLVQQICFTNKICICPFQGRISIASIRNAHLHPPAPHFIFAPKEINGLKSHSTPNFLFLSSPCLEIAIRSFQVSPATIFTATVSVTATAAVSLGEKSEGRCFCQSRFIALQQKSSSPLFCSFARQRDSEGRRTEEEKAGRKMKLLLHSPLFPF